MRAEHGHAVVLLAAGHSRRLGEPKQLLRREGETLLARSLRLAALSRPTQLRVVANAVSADWMPAVDDAPVDVQLAAGAQLSDSLRAGLLGLSEAVSACLILPCDLPRLQASHLNRLLALGAAAPSGIAVVRHGARPGIPVLLPAPFDPWIELLRGDHGLQSALSGRAAEQIGWLDAPELGADIDTPEQLAAARADGWIDPPLNPGAAGPYS